MQTASVQQLIDSKDVVVALSYRTRLDHPVLPLPTKTPTMGGYDLTFPFPRVPITHPCVCHAQSLVTVCKNGPVAITEQDFNYQLHGLIAFD